MTRTRYRLLGVASAPLALLLLPAPLSAAQAAGEEAVTFTKDIAPIPTGGAHCRPSRPD